MRNRTPAERREARAKSQKANALFTDGEVRQIRARLAKGGISYLELAQELGCGVGTLRKLNNGETYGWVMMEGGEVSRNLLPPEAAPAGFDTGASLRILQERLGQEAKVKAALDGAFAGGAVRRSPEEIAEDAQREADEADRRYVASLPKAEEL